MKYFVSSVTISPGTGSQDVPQHYLLHPQTGLHGNLDEGGGIDRTACIGKMFWFANEISIV